MTQYDVNRATDGATNDCPTRKRAYLCRRDAHKAAVRLRKQGVHVRPYLCTRGCGQFHVGHIPTAVLGGATSSVSWYSRPQAGA